VPDYVKNYSDKMQWILMDGMHDGNDKAVILDDDLVFSTRYRTPKGKPGLLTAKPDDDFAMQKVKTQFDFMEELLDDTPLVGIHPRQMGHMAPLPYKENGKIVCIQGINRRLIPRIKINYFPILSDVFLNANLLARGLGNKIITGICVDWGTCQAPGGCSIYRTPAMQKQACEALERMYGPYITVKKKESKNGWLGGERYDFVGQWKKLGASGLLDKGTGNYTGEERRGTSPSVEY
jgi:hypothetical protein